MASNVDSFSSPKPIEPTSNNGVTENVPASGSVHTKTSSANINTDVPPSLKGYQLKNVRVPLPNDVLCGRGGGTNNHAGNEKFRDLVNGKKRLYLNSSKREKPKVSKMIVDVIRNQKPPGRFLQKDEKTSLWYDIGDQKAREKTSQALREGAPVIRREISIGAAANALSIAASVAAGHIEHDVDGSSDHEDVVVVEDDFRNAPPPTTSLMSTSSKTFSDISDTSVSDELRILSIQQKIRAAQLKSASVSLTDFSPDSNISTFDVNMAPMELLRRQSSGFVADHTATLSDINNAAVDCHRPMQQRRSLMNLQQHQSLSVSRVQRAQKSAHNSHHLPSRHSSDYICHNGTADQTLSMGLNQPSSMLLRMQPRQAVPVPTAAAQMAARNLQQHRRISDSSGSGLGTSTRSNNLTTRSSISSMSSADDLDRFARSNLGPLGMNRQAAATAMLSGVSNFATNEYSSLGVMAGAALAPSTSLSPASPLSEDVKKRLLLSESLAYGAAHGLVPSSTLEDLQQASLYRQAGLLALNSDLLMDSIRDGQSMQSIIGSYKRKLIDRSDDFCGPAPVTADVIKRQKRRQVEEKSATRQRIESAMCSVGAF